MFRWSSISLLAAVVSYAVLVLATDFKALDDGTLSPQAVFVDPSSFAVVGNGSFRKDAFGQVFNPSTTAAPFFQVFDRDFARILGPKASIRRIAVNATYAFAHEAPIYNADTEEVFFASNAGGSLGMSDLNRNNKVWKLSIAEAEAGLKSGSGDVNVPVTQIPLPESVQMTNGGTGPYHGSLVFINSGRGPRAPTISLTNPIPPYNTTIILDNFFGRQFNSLNDIKVHPSGMIFFTDVTYGYLLNFRPEPVLPNQVYRLDPKTGAVRVIADGFARPNGIAFSRDGKTAYIADTGAANGFWGRNQTYPATIYGFDVDLKDHTFRNRRVFAYIDTGVPDGVQVDTDGNVYAGCGDGVHVWDRRGKLLGKFFINTTSANMVFAGDGRLVILAETAVYLAHIAAKSVSLGGK